MKTHLHTKGWTLRLALRKRLISQSHGNYEHTKDEPREEKEKQLYLRHYNALTRRVEQRNSRRCCLLLSKSETRLTPFRVKCFARCRRSTYVLNDAAETKRTNKPASESANEGSTANIYFYFFFLYIFCVPKYV